MGSVGQGEVMAYTNHAIQTDNMTLHSVNKNDTDLSEETELSHPNHEHKVDTRVSRDERKLFVTGIAEINDILSREKMDFYSIRRALQSGRIALLRSPLFLADVCVRCQHLKGAQKDSAELFTENEVSTGNCGNVGVDFRGKQVLAGASANGQIGYALSHEASELNGSMDELGNSGGFGSKPTVPGSELVLDVTRL